MQNFLPYADFRSCALALDPSRLGNQRNETMTTLRTLMGETDGWLGHPAVEMWRGHEALLVEYGIAICQEWRRRGNQDSLLPWFAGMRGMFPDSTAPPWLGDERLHSSHRAALLAKDFAWYCKFGWAEIPRIDYYWPV